MQEYEKVLNEKQKSKVKNYLANNGKLIRAMGSCLTNKRKSPDARAMQKGDVETIKQNFVNLYNLLPDSAKRRFKEIVCKQMDYCNKKPGYQSIVWLVSAMIGFFLNYVKDGIIAILTGAVVFRFLDEICDC